MTTTFDTTRDTKAGKGKRAERLSPDGKWRAFPKVPNLLQYVSTGLYYGRLKVNGKLVRRGLKANTFEEAKLALHDFVQKESRRRHVVGAPVTFGEARGLYEAGLDNDTTLSPKSRHYRKECCLKRLLKSWPGLDNLKLRAIRAHDCEAWAKRLSTEPKMSAQYFNNIVGTFKAVLKRAGIAHDADSPLYNVKRMGIDQTPPKLPEPEQFNRIIQEIETSGSGRQQYAADFARFLAFTGCRLSEARAATWADVDLQKGILTVHNAKVRRQRNYVPTRAVPIIPDLRDLLTRLLQDKPKPSDPICKVAECEKSLIRACGVVGIPTLTHHDLRHLFATRCIEAGVDIPTVSRWLGHADGGALAMRVYGHLRERHSAEMAWRVTFSTPTAQDEKTKTEMKGTL